MRRFNLSCRNVGRIALAAMLLGAATLQSDTLFESGAGWRENSLLGSYWQSEGTWIWTPAFGWTYPVEHDSGLHLWTPAYGWIETKPSWYPSFFSIQDMEWYRVLDTEDWIPGILSYWSGSIEDRLQATDERLIGRLPAIMEFAWDRTAGKLDELTDPNQYPERLEKGATRWINTTSSGWTSGFFPGELWLHHLADPDAGWIQAAVNRQAGIEREKTRTTTHDIGFMVGIPFMLAYEATGNDLYRNVVTRASGSLATRYSATVGALRSWSWGSWDDGNRFTVIVDNLMNLRMLLWASRQPGGNPQWEAMAIEHGLTTIRELMREDGSTYHVVVFDKNTGSVLEKTTHQGYNGQSTWSRGQAWAIYGFTDLAIFTGDSRFVDAAVRSADYWMKNLPVDRIPPYDFDDPSAGVPKDSSAAAVAAAGLFRLAEIIEADQPVKAKDYRETAMEMLFRLSFPPYLRSMEAVNAILGEGSVKKGSHHQSLSYGDYYFVEALLHLTGHLRNPGIFGYETE